MYVLTVLHQKGGAGKSPTTVHTSFAIARAGKKVLFIDADPQGTASLHFLGLAYRQQRPTLFDAMGEATDPVRIEPLPIRPNLHLLPAHSQLEVAEVNLVAKRGFFWQQQLLKLIRLYPEYDYVVIDTPGSRISIFATLALTAANLVIVPMRPTYDHQDATIDSLSLIEDVKGGLNPQLELWGILPNQLQSNSAHDEEILQMLREKYGELVYEPSRHTTKYKDALVARADINELDRALGQYWDAIAASIIKKGGGGV
jgi:chromosome partitioning protein